MSRMGPGFIGDFGGDANCEKETTDSFDFGRSVRRRG